MRSVSLGRSVLALVVVGGVTTLGALAGRAHDTTGEGPAAPGPVQHLTGRGQADLVSADGAPQPR